MAAGAGARRTETAYQDLVEETDGLDAAVVFGCNPARNPNCPSEVDEIRALPGVADAALFLSPLVPVTDEDGDLVQLLDDPCYSGAGGLQVLIPQGPEFGTSMSRRRIIEGRDLDPTAADEVVIAPLIAEETGVEVGDRLFVNLVEDCLADPGTWPPPAAVTVVGIGMTSSEIPPKNGFYLQGLHTSPAFADRLPPEFDDFFEDAGARQAAGAGVALRLEPGVTLEDLAEDPGFPRFDVVIDDAFIAEPVDAGLQTDANALWVLALVGGLASLAVLGPTLARFHAELAENDRMLMALGWSRRQRVARSALHGMAVSVPATAIAIIVTAIASLSTPIGDARNIEPDPGAELDPLVLLIGTAALVVFVVGLVALLARLPVRTTPRPRQTPVARLAARVGFAPPAVLGIRIGLEPAPRQAPVRSSIFAVVVGLTTVTGVLAYTSSAQYLREHPDRLGLTWEDFVYLGETEGGVAITEEARSWPEVDAVGHLLFFTPGLAIGPDHLPARVMAFSTGVDAVAPRVIDGRVPATEDEILLSPLLADDAGLGIGDRLEVVMEIEVYPEEGEPELVTTPPFPLEVVGIGPVPIGDGFFDQGSAMTVDGLLSHYPPDAREAGDEDRTDFMALVRAPGVTDQALVDRLAGVGVAYDPNEFDVDALLNNVVSVDPTSTESAPDLLALFMGLLAVGVLLYGVGMAVGRNRHDLAVTRALGLSPRLLRRTGRWAGIAFAAAALAVAVPLGLVIGRVTWRTYASGLGVVPDPVVSAREIVALIAITLLLAALSGTLASRWQTRTRPGRILRSE